MDPKKLVFLGTGGTIAGSASHALDQVGYTAAQIGIEALLHALPAWPAMLDDYTPVCEQVAQIDSKDMDWPQWHTLAQRTAHHLAQPEVAAVVVTHGTDTLEETAFFLSQVLPHESLAHKPVVLTGAMRPASALVADGPANLLDAVTVAQNPAAHGVLVVFAGSVHAAHAVQKAHPYRLHAFASGDAGALGYVEAGTVRWVQPCPTPAPTHDLALLERWATRPWPRVEIILNHVGARGALVRALCAAPTDGGPPLQGLVVAGTGNGTIHHDLEAALLTAQGQGIRVVRASRCALGPSPIKARIALLLELMAAA